MAKHKVEDVRNIALVGHGATGKTTLADYMLFKAGENTRAGSVDEKSSLIDVDDDEKERGHSITSSVCHFEHGGKHINVIDTPGYPEFIGGAIGALRAVETAVITVSAGAGIEVNTRRTFARAGEAGVGRVVLVNKCDMENVNFPQVVADLQELFGQGCVPLNVPVGSGADFSGVVSTLNIPDDVPGNVAMDPSEINQTLMDAIVEADEALMERFLEGEELPAAEIAGAVGKAITEGTLIRSFCTSSKTASACRSSWTRWPISPWPLPIWRAQRKAKTGTTSS